MRRDDIENDILTISEIQYVGEAIALYLPLPGDQTHFHESLAEIRWLFGGNKSGKSYANMMDLAMLALGVHPCRHIENGTIWVCTETWDMCRDVLYKEYIKKFIPEKQIAHIDWGYAHCPSKIHLKNGNVIEFRAFSQGRGSFQGRSIDAIYCDEQCLHDLQGIFEEIQARLILLNGFLSWSMTPIKAQILLEDRIADLPPTDEAFYLNLNDNRISRGGYVSDRRIDQLIAEWAEEVQETRIKGHFAAFVGNVYKSFRRDVHVIESFPIPEDWDKWRSVDFGFSSPFVNLWIAQDGDGNYFVYDEYYRAQEVIGEHIKEVKRRSGKKKYRATFADPENAEGRKQFQNAGIKTKAPKKDINAGIEMVQSKLKVKANGDPSLFIFSSCKHTILEFGAYRYSENKRDDNPIKKDDHCLDALRYCVYTLEKPKKKGRAILVTR